MTYPTKKGDKFVFKTGFGIKIKGTFTVSEFCITYWSTTHSPKYDNLEDLLNKSKNTNYYNNLIISLDTIFKNKDLNESTYPRVGVHIKETNGFCELGTILSLSKIRQNKINRINGEG